MFRIEREPYGSDVSDREWELIREFMPRHPPRGNDPRVLKREIVNAILCQQARLHVAWVAT